MVRAMGSGGLDFEDDTPDTPAEAMAVLEVGLARWVTVGEFLSGSDRREPGRLGHPVKKNPWLPTRQANSPTVSIAVDKSRGALSGPEHLNPRAMSGGERGPPISG